MKRKNIATQDVGGVPKPLLLVVAVMVFLLPLLVPGISRGADVTGASSTYLLSKQAADESQDLPLFEYLNFSVQSNSPLSAHFSGWGRYDSKSSRTNLQYGYISYRGDENNTIVNVGRVLVFEGVARELIDGVSGHTDLPAGFDIAAFDGIPVETGIADPSYIGNNIVYGGRLSQGLSSLYKIGASYLKEEKSTNTFREEVGVDLWVHPFEGVDIAGKSSYNASTKGWMEHSYGVTIVPFSKITLGLDVSKIDYQHYFSALTSAAYAPTSLFKAVDVNETSTATGGSLAAALTDKTTLSLGLTHYNFSVAGAASSYGATLAASAAGLHDAGISYRRMSADSSKRLRYHEFRLYAFERYRNVNFGIDLFDVVYDETINGMDSSLSLSVVSDYDLTEEVTIGGDVEYARNPDFDKDVRVFIKLRYNFGAREGA